MGHYYHGSITIDPKTTRAEMLAAADAADGKEPEYRRGITREWIESLPETKHETYPWVIPWWGNFRGVNAAEFCEALARNNMGRVRTLVMVQVDEEPRNEESRPNVHVSDYSTWVAPNWVGFQEKETPRCAHPLE